MVTSTAEKKKSQGIRFAVFTSLVFFVEIRVHHVSWGTVGNSRRIWNLHRVFVTQQATGVTHRKSLRGQKTKTKVHPFSSERTLKGKAKTSNDTLCI